MLIVPYKCILPETRTKEKISYQIIVARALNNLEKNYFYILFKAKN